MNEQMLLQAAHRQSQAQLQAQAQIQQLQLTVALHRTSLAATLLKYAQERMPTDFYVQQRNGNVTNEQLIEQEVEKALEIATLLLEKGNVIRREA